jgi:thioredoxin
MVKNINKVYFDKNVYDTDIKDSDEIKFLGKKPVLLDFHAKWCGPCKALGPILEELDKEYDGKIDIYKMDIEDELEVSQQFGVKSVPTLVFIPLEGKPAISAGAPSKDQLKEIVDEKLLNNTKGSCCDKKENKEDPVSTFNKIMDRIRSLIG